MQSDLKKNLVKQKEAAEMDNHHSIFFEMSGNYEVGFFFFDAPGVPFTFANRRASGTQFL